MSVDLKRMLAVLDEKLALLEQRHAEQVKPYTAIPSACQFFFYLPDSNGYVRTQQDAAFVLMRIHVPSDWSGIQLVDANTGRNYVTATRRVPAKQPTPTFPVTNPFPSAVQPSAVGMATPFQPGTLDFNYALDSAVTIPRGGVVRIVPQITFNVTPPTGTVEPTPTTDVFSGTTKPVLLGYKVFG